MATAIPLSLPRPLRRAPVPPPAGPAPGDADAALLEDLRRWSLAALCGPPLDLDRACALIAPAGEAARDACGRALLAALDGAALRPLSFHPRGAAVPAFGEAWLLALLRATAEGDGDSARFLVARAVRRERRRLILWLARRLVEVAGVAKPPQAV